MQLLRALGLGASSRRGRRRARARSADVTARRALEALAAPDASAALVFALVHDAEFRLAQAVASSPEGAADPKVARALLQAFAEHEDQLRRLLGRLMYREMAATLNWNELFRASSAVTALLREYTSDLGMDFLHAALGDVVADLVAEHGEVQPNELLYEVNPRFLTAEDDLAANQRRLEAVADRVLDRLLQSAPLFPYQVAKVYRVLEVEMRRLLERDARLNRMSSLGVAMDASAMLPRLSSFSRMDRAATATSEISTTPDEESRISTGNGSSRSLPRLSSIDEDLTDGSTAALRRSSRGSNASLIRVSSSTSSTTATARDEFLLHLGGLLFLRFICPALVAPHTMGLTPDGAPLGKREHRALVLVAKLLQSLANGVDGPRGEMYMTPFAPFLTRNRPRLTRLYDTICQQFENDERRESTVMRSNATPRLSQLWGLTSSRSSSTGSVTSGSGRGIAMADGSQGESSDDALNVLRRWIHAHMDALVDEVTDNDRFQSEKAGNEVDTGSTLADGAAPPAKRRKKRQKRKLKTSNGRDSLVFPTDRIVEDGDDNEDSDSGGGMVDDSSEDEEVEDGGVTPSEFDALVGQTMHRDIQVMKLYYARVVSRGLARLLRVNDAAHSREWTLYKKAGADNESEVQIFRRTRAFAERNSKLVEMKAVVHVRKPPREVFAYLKTLESAAPSVCDGVSESDAAMTTIRQVEPIDDAKTVLYRSCGRLSIWPSWLVKPRDSCDLHGFVEHTGRADTFAVLLESVPRPDVPEIRGVVRMAFASGGLLVEPESSSVAKMERKQISGLSASTTAATTPSATATIVDRETTRLTCILRADFNGTMPRYLAESICFRQVMRVDALRRQAEAREPRLVVDEEQKQSDGDRPQRSVAATEWV